MKTIFASTTLAALIAGAAVMALGQAENNDKVKAALIAQVTQANTAWLKKDKQFFQDTVSEEAQFVLYFGVFSKPQILLAATMHNCTFKDPVVDNAKLTMPDLESAVLTYRVTQEVTCNGKAEPTPSWCSTSFVKRKGKWLVILHQETPAQKN